MTLVCRDVATGIDLGTPNEGEILIKGGMVMYGSVCVCVCLPCYI